MTERQTEIMYFIISILVIWLTIGAFILDRRVALIMFIASIIDTMVRMKKEEQKKEKIQKMFSDFCDELKKGESETDKTLQ